MKRLFKQFSFPGGIPSHVAPETPGSIHEGGELGYALAHAFGAAFDNPGLLVCCVVGDGEAETGPLAASWHGNKFLNPVTDGAVLPVLHLNGYKIANPTVLARIGDDELTSLLEGYGHSVHWVDGDEPAAMHERMAEVLDAVVGEIASIQHTARRAGGDPGLVIQRGDPRTRHVPARRDRAQPVALPPLRPGRDDVEPSGRRVRGDRPHLERRDAPRRRPPRARRPRDGGALRAPVP